MAKEKFTFTRAELKAAFLKWNKAYNNNPMEFEKQPTDDENAKGQADALIKYLTED